MQVCHISSVHARYDIRIFIKECQALLAEHQVSLIVADSLGDETKNGIRIYDVGKPSGGRVKRMKIAGKAIFIKLLQLNPQVIHFHDPELIGIGRKLARRGYKVIYDVHEDVPKQVMNKPWIPKVLRPLISTVVEMQESRASQEFAGIICATDIIAKRFRTYNPNTITLHNFPILAELYSEQVVWEQRNPTICYIGSISANRGILPLIDSLFHSKLRLELAGLYSDEQIKSDIQLSNGYPWVNYHGVLDRNGIIKLLAQASVGMVTLLPTPSYVESLPIKLFEYMLAGIPVIASDFPLWQPIVNGHNCGLLVDPNDHRAIAAACTWLLEHPAEARQMGQNGRAAVLANYTWDKEKLKLVQFYSKL